MYSTILHPILTLFLLNMEGVPIHLHWFSEVERDFTQPKAKQIKPHSQLTFIIRRMVLSTMSVIMKYSNGVDTTTRQILYFRLSISFGM